jgi:hypothetical protein
VQDVAEIAPAERRLTLSTLLFHALRRDELCKLKVKDFNQSGRGVPHLSVTGKGEKTRYLRISHSIRAPTPSFTIISTRPATPPQNSGSFSIINPSARRPSADGYRPR